MFVRRRATALLPRLVGLGECALGFAARGIHPRVKHFKKMGSTLNTSGWKGGVRCLLNRAHSPPLTPRVTHAKGSAPCALGHTALYPQVDTPLVIQVKRAGG